MPDSKKFFLENIRLQGGPDALRIRDPQHYNLLFGLAEIGRQLDEIQETQALIATRLDQMQAELDRLG